MTRYNVSKPLFSAEEIQLRVSELAHSISTDYSGREILAIGILKGAFMFFADLVRALKIPVKVDFIIATSYRKTTSTGEVKIYYEHREEIAGKDVLLIDDIVDTGISINFLKERLLSLCPATLKTCVLLDKKKRRVVDVQIDYVGFEIPDEFVVGYGLDFENNFRNLPHIAVLKTKVFD